ncbi:MAG: carotenoid oxygenase family protein [Gammaproteobacteria bacterium]|nr:carotenoid oxygenase family protein [Gammaproteobacteria bacterium]
MTDKNNDKTSQHRFNRREILGGAIGIAGAAAGAGLIGNAQAQPPGGPGGGPIPDAFQTPSLFRLESDVRNCQVTGNIPDDLNGAFYRVGPDAQYPLRQGNIPFDGEGHVSMFRIKNGRADYKSRYVKNDRWKAQDEAGRILFPMYRNPSMDDPSVAGLSRSTANTHIINHKNYLLALKEDSPPAAMDLLTLETVEPNFTFGDKLPSQTFTAHPKVDSRTGNMVAFGYEATGFGSDDVSLFEFSPQGDLIWNAMVKVPYVGMLHDFAVTENYIVIYVIPMVIDHQQIQEGGIHWAWNDSGRTHFGVVRRDGDGSDMRWFTGPTRSATHVMGAFEDGGRVYVDVEMSESNPFPFMPMQEGKQWDPVRGTSYMTRLSADMNNRSISGYDIERLYEYRGALPRQDDRYNTASYRYGFLGTRDKDASNPRQANAGYIRMDHATRTTVFWDAGQGTSLAECCFAPKHDNAREGEGYLLGLATRQNEDGRGDLVILDAEHLEDGPVAVVHLPIQAVGQVHGWWVPESQLPVA